MGSGDSALLLLNSVRPIVLETLTGTHHSIRTHSKCRPAIDGTMKQKGPGLPLQTHVWVLLVHLYCLLCDTDFHKQKSGFTQPDSLDISFYSAEAKNSQMFQLCRHQSAVFFFTFFIVDFDFCYKLRLLAVFCLRFACCSLLTKS